MCLVVFTPPASMKRRPTTTSGVRLEKVTVNDVCNWCLFFKGRVIEEEWQKSVSVNFRFDTLTRQYTVLDGEFDRGRFCSVVVYKDSMILLGGKKGMKDYRYALKTNGGLGERIPMRERNFPFMSVNSVVCGSFLIALSWTKCEKSRLIRTKPNRNPTPTKCCVSLEAINLEDPAGDWFSLPHFPGGRHLRETNLRVKGNMLWLYGGYYENTANQPQLRPMKRVFSLDLSTLPKGAWKQTIATQKNPHPVEDMPHPLVLANGADLYLQLVPRRKHLLPTLASVFVGSKNGKPHRCVATLKKYGEEDFEETPHTRGRYAAALNSF